MKLSDIDTDLKKEFENIDYIINENDLMDKRKMKTDKENNIIVPNDDFDEVEQGVIHFLPTVEKILSGEIKMTRIDPNLSFDEFCNKYIYGSN